MRRDGCRVGRCEEVGDVQGGAAVPHVVRQDRRQEPAQEETFVCRSEARREGGNEKARVDQVHPNIEYHQPFDNK